MKLVDSQHEQTILEEEIETVKPAIPADSENYDWLLFTPFRYGAPYPTGSRFRRSGLTEGVFYCCESPITAMAEKAFWQLLFFAESPGLQFLNNPIECTVFSVHIRTQRCIDLTEEPLAKGSEQWNLLSDYAFCQELADTARQCATEVIRYRSQRDPSKGLNLAVLSKAAFATRKRLCEQSWHLQLQKSVVWAKCEAPAQTISFDVALFLADPRLKPLRPLLSANFS